MNLKDYKNSIIQYKCDDCLIVDTFSVEFSEVAKVKPGSCKHFNINFLLMTERKEIKCSSSFTCKNCKFNKIIELFNKTVNKKTGNIIYSCQNCKNGKMNVGFLLGTELIDLYDKEFDEKYGHLNNKDKRINLIFSYNDKEYNINVEPNILIPEALYQLCLNNKNNDLENLDIQYYKKEGKILSQFKTIEELNLKNRDKITIEIRNNPGW